jgi:predicted phosphoribosyltransferase
VSDQDQARRKAWEVIVEAHEELVIDLNRSGTPIGIEIAAPTKLSAAALNRVLRRFGFPPVTRADLAPLRAA